MQEEVIRYLISLKVDLEEAMGGLPPLHHAIDIEIDSAAQQNASEFPEPTLTRLLLEAGASIDSHDYKGRTPLEFARVAGHKKAEALLKSW